VTDILAISLERNPDARIERYERFGIGDVRSLKVRAYTAPLGPRQVFVLVMGHISHDAQHALLKLLEEPPAVTHFVLIVPDAHLLLGTVRSRVLHASTLQPQGENQTQALIRGFRDAPLVERLATVLTYIEAGDREQCKGFLDSYARLLRGELPQSKGALQEVLWARGYISDPASSIKMLLEHVAHVT
jgi:DNA polymerase III delta prime subunit